MLYVLDLDKVIYDLISLVENKFELLEEIYALTKCQTEVIEAVDMELLSELIDRKQEKIDLIRKSDLQSEAIVSDIKILYGVELAMIDDDIELSVISAHIDICVKRKKYFMTHIVIRFPTDHFSTI